MSHWQRYEPEGTYYILVDGKPDEIVKPSSPNVSFCLVFVATGSAVNGVRQSDLPWLKQYKECSSLEESLEVLNKLHLQIVVEDNFQELEVKVLHANYSSIDSNATGFLQHISDEVSELVLDKETVHLGNSSFNINKAKMLIWYNVCLCVMAPYLVSQTIRWGKKRSVFLIDRLGDDDRRIQKFMRMIFEKTSIRELWLRAAEDYETKPEFVGYEYASHKKDNGKIVPAQNSMQAALVDWLVLGGYAKVNGRENRDLKFQQNLEGLVGVLEYLGKYQEIELNNPISWDVGT